MLIVINTWNRQEVFSATLASVKRCKWSKSEVGVVDDCSPAWTQPDVAHVWRAPHHLGVGLARRYALECCLSTSYELFLVMDNDLSVEPGFDRNISVWLAHRHNHPGCIGSPYRPLLREHTDRELDMRPYLGNYIFGTSTAGAMLWLDRQVIEFILRRMPVECWSTMWDWNLSGYINGCIKPLTSLAVHVGAGLPDALHPPT